MLLTSTRRVCSIVLQRVLAIRIVDPHKGKDLRAGGFNEGICSDELQLIKLA